MYHIASSTLVLNPCYLPLSDQWDLMKCKTCGQAGAHPFCLGFEKRGPKDWSCATCVSIEVSFN